MLTVTSWWAHEASQVNNKPVRTLHYISYYGSAYNMTHGVDKWPSVKTQANNFAPSTVAFELNHSELPEDALGAVSSWQPGGQQNIYLGYWSIQAGFFHQNSGWENYEVFRGRTQNRSLREGRVSITIRGTAQDLTDFKVGGDLEGEEVLYGTQTRGNPAVCMYDLITENVSQTDDTLNETNSTFNYSAWNNWLATFSYWPWRSDMKMKCTGQTVNALAKEILKQTHSIGAVQVDGRLIFRRRNGLDESTGGYAHQVDDVITNDVILSAGYDDSRFTRPTRAAGYIRDSGGVLNGKIERENLLARIYFGIREDVWQSEQVWHTGTTLAAANLEQLVGNQGEMPMIADLELPFIGMRQDACDIIQITDSANNVDSYWWNVMERSVDLETCRVKLKCEQRMPQYYYEPPRIDTTSTHIKLGSRIRDLSDVSSNTPSSGDLLLFTASGDLWHPFTPQKIDTSIGKGTFVFSGHAARYLNMVNSTAVDIKQGDLVRSYALAADSVFRISVRNGSSARSIGVALEDIDAGTWGKVGIDGEMDVKMYNGAGSQNVIISDCDVSGSYHKGQYTSSGYTLGWSQYYPGSAYHWDGADLWARIKIFRESS